MKFKKRGGQILNIQSVKFFQIIIIILKQLLAILKAHQLARIKLPTYRTSGPS